jgi:hypothetical protein
MSYISVKDRLPKEVGEYEVETNYGKSVAFYIRTISGRLKWMCVNEDYRVIKWKQK